MSPLVDLCSFLCYLPQLGNPVLEFSTDFNSRAEFFWSHGLISDSTYRIFTSACNYSRYVSEYYRGSLSSVCQRVMSQVTRETSRFVDKYDVTLDVCISSVLSQSMVLSPQVSSGAVVLVICVFSLTLHLRHAALAASYRACGRVRGRRDGEVSQPERRAVCPSCPPRRSYQMDRLQQVSMLNLVPIVAET